MINTVIKTSLIAIVTTTPLLLSACGGGGGGSSTATVTPAPAPTPTTAQTINTFTIPALAVGASTALTATATSGLAVSYSSTTPTTCTVSGNTLTGTALGTCRITASQAGNTTYITAPDISKAVIIGEQSINLSLPASVMVGQTYPITATATSKFPVTFTSQTPSACTVAGMLLVVTSTVPSSCTITATQNGNQLYAPAPAVKGTIAIDAASLAVASGARAPVSVLPQPGSTTADASTTSAGIYENAQGFGFIDNHSNISYFNPSSTLFGQITISGLSWSLTNALAYSGTKYTNVNPTINGVTVANNTPTVAHANGSYINKSALIAASQSFTTTPSPLQLYYGPANGYAMTQASVSGKWMINTGDTQFMLSIDDTGTFTGTYSTQSGYLCALTGTLTQADPLTSHNLYTLSLQSAPVPNSAATCPIDAHPFSGSAAIRVFPATATYANGYLPAIAFIASNSNNANFPLELFKQQYATPLSP